MREQRPSPRLSQGRDRSLGRDASATPEPLLIAGDRSVEFLCLELLSLMCFFTKQRG
jgi:hypothetical protein